MFRNLVILVVMFGLYSGLGAQAQAQTQPVVYWVGPPTVDVSEGVGTTALQIGLTEPWTGSQFVIYAVQAGGTATVVADYTGGSGFVSWTPGDLSVKNIPLSIVDDAIAEPTETLFLVISNADGPLISPTDNVLQINIIDNDGPGGLPRATIVDSSGHPGEVSEIYCPGALGQLFPCGASTTFRFPWEAGRGLYVQLDAAPAPGDTITIGVESWGAARLTNSVITFTDSDNKAIPYSMATGGWAAFGGVRLVAPGVIAPPVAGEFHEARILIDEIVPWGVDHCALCILTIYLVTDRMSPCEDVDCQLTIGCGAKSSGKSTTTAVADLNLLRRYRDETLAASSEGLAVVDLYGAMGGGVVQAFLSDPGLGADFAAVRNGWFPALTNLLDGDGSMVVSALMQAQLTGLLDNLAAAAGSELAVQLADLRSSAGLDALVGMTIATANAQFTTGGATPIESTSWGNLKAQFR